MKKTNEAIENIKLHGYDLDFGTVFNHAFETYKKIAINGGIAFLLYILLLVIVGGGLVIGIIGFGIDLDDLQNFTIANFSAVGILVYMVVMILFTSLTSPFNAGLVKMARNASKNEEFSIGTAFEYYSSSYFKDIFAATLILSSFTTLVAVGLELVDYKFLGVVVNLLFSFMTFLTVPLIVFGDLKPLDAIQGSITVVSKQFFILLGLLIVAGLFCMLGIFALCIGIVFTMPILSAITYSIYATAIDDEEPENAEEEFNENTTTFE